MDIVIVIAIAVVAAYVVVDKLFANPARKSNEQLVSEYTVFLNRRALGGRAFKVPFQQNAEPAGSPAADELRRRGFDPDLAIGERFDARREKRPMRWEDCRLDAGGSSERGPAEKLGETPARSETSAS